MHSETRRDGTGGDQGEGEGEHQNSLIKVISVRPLQRLSRIRVAGAVRCMPAHTLCRQRNAFRFASARDLRFHTASLCVS